MAQLIVRQRQSGTVTILDLSGKLTIVESNGVLRHAVRGAVDQGNKRILLNMIDVTHMDSSGIGELVSSYTTTIQSGGHFKLLRLNPNIHDVLTRTKMLSVFQSFDDERVALESF